MGEKKAVRKTVEKYLSEGRTIQDAKEKMISSGLNRILVNRFTTEITGEKP